MSNPEIDITKFVNIWHEDFTFYVNNEPRVVKTGEAKMMPIYVAQLGAKHLVDLILGTPKDKGGYGIANTLVDTELRRSTFAKILPDMAEERGIKPLSKEEEEKAILLELKKQGEVIKSLTEKTTEKEKEDSDKIAKLEKEIDELKKLVSEKKSPGRPKKVETPTP